MVFVMTFSIDDHGYLRSPYLHDGFVDGILLAGESAVTVLLRDVKDRTFSMQLIGVEHLACDDFRQGNIILHVQIVSGIAPNDDTLRSLLGPPHPKAAQEFHDRHEQFLQKKIEKIKAGSLTLVSIDPSYGCYLRALCRDVVISPRADGVVVP